MNQAIQQIPPTPAQRLAAKIRARTNDTRDILNLLHDIAEGGHDATEHDKLTATGILFDRGYGKCPKSAPVLSQARPEPGRRVEGPDTGPDPNLDPETDDDDVEPAPVLDTGGDSRIAPSRRPQRTRIPQARLTARRLPARVSRPSARTLP